MSTINESMDARILSQEGRAIELLAQETHTDIAAVRRMFLVEYKRLAEHARIRAYLPLLASHRVREILESANPANKEAR